MQIGLADLGNKDAKIPVKFEFQIYNRYLYIEASPIVIFGIYYY